MQGMVCKHICSQLMPVCRAEKQKNWGSLKIQICHIHLQPDVERHCKLQAKHMHGCIYEVFVLSPGNSRSRNKSEFDACKCTVGIDEDSVSLQGTGAP